MVAPLFAFKPKNSMGNERNSQRSSLVYPAAICAVLALTALLLVSSSLQDSQTHDEAVHLVSGYSYWKTGDFRLSPEHPPLSKLIAALPLLWLQPNFTPLPEQWDRADPWPIGKSFLYANHISADTILMAGRAPVMLLSLVLGASLAWWVGRIAGRLAGFAALLMFAFEPTVLAHSRYVTTDIPVTLFIWLSCISWYSYLEHGSNRLLVLTGVLTGLAFGTKFNALFLPFVFLFTWGKLSRRTWSTIAILLGIALLIALSIYGFKTGSIAEDPSLSSQLGTIGPADSLRSKAIHLRVPGYFFFRGIQALMRDEIGGHQTYFMGRLFHRGTWKYFPAAFLLKGCLAWLALLLLAGILAVTQAKRPKVRLLAVPVFVYLAFASVDSFNIGIRHLLPIYPFLCAIAAIVLFNPEQKAYIKAVGTILMVLFLAESATAYPDYLSFFNRAVGGTKNGHHYLLDSNLDWGQDLKRLKHYLSAHRIQKVCLSYFGTADPAFSGIQYEPLPLLRNAEDLNALNCVAVISLQNLYATQNLPFEALQQLKPTDRVGASFFIYDFRR
jgi:hypothetical protein